MMIKKDTRMYILFLFIFLATGCSSSPASTTRLPVTITKPMSTSSITPEIEPSKVSSPIPTRTLKLTIMDTITPRDTLPLSPKNTLTPGPMFTPSPLPTLDPTQAQAMILDLLQNNAGCRLPCWWGFTPGITRWEDARRFLATFAKIVDYPGPPTGEIYNPEIIIPVPQDIFLQPLDYTYYTKDQGDEKVVNMIMGSPGHIPSYQLPAVLSEYGQPDEVWFLSSAGVSGSHDVPFIVVLFYGTQDFAIEYNISVPLRMPIIGCPQQAKYPTFWVWSALEGKTYADLASETNQFGYDVQGSTPFLPLKQATGMSVETFYNTFKNESNTTCLETPLELWLAPGQKIISTTVATTTP